MDDTEATLMETIQPELANFAKDKNLARDKLLAVYERLAAEENISAEENVVEKILLPNVLPSSHLKLDDSQQPKTTETGASSGAAASSRKDKSRRTRQAQPLGRKYLGKAGRLFEISKALKETKRLNHVSTIILCSEKLPAAALGFAHEESYIPLEEPCGVSQDNVLIIRGRNACAEGYYDFVREKSYIPLEEPCCVSQDNILIIRGSTAGAEKQDDFACQTSYIRPESPCGVSQHNVLTICRRTAGAGEQDDNLGHMGSFPGKVIIQDRSSAMAFALDEHESSRPDTDRMVLWADGADSKGRSFLGMAVAFKQWCDGVSPTWSLKSYKVHKTRVALGAHQGLDAEIWAIRQALQVARERISHGDFSTRAHAASPIIVAVYSDCQLALQIIRDFRLSGQCCGPPMLEGIIAQADALRAIGAQIYLHWVPGHAGIPGNELADKLAKRATERNGLQSNNFQEAGDGTSEIKLQDGVT